MYECVVFARYLSLHPELTANYLATFHTQWAKVLASLPDANVSGLVHPSALFLIGHLSQETEGAFEISATNQEDEAIWALQLSHALILNAVELRLQYEPSVELQEGLNLCREDFEKIWGYSLPI
jgi:hypothetical protein